MTHHFDMYATHAKLPAGFKRRRKNQKACPFEPEARVEFMVRTSEGLGSSGPTRPKYHDWSISPDSVGGIVGYRAL